MNNDELSQKMREFNEELREMTDLELKRVYRRIVRKIEDDMPHPTTEGLYWAYLKEMGRRGFEAYEPHNY